MKILFVIFVVNFFFLFQHNVIGSDSTYSELSSIDTITMKIPVDGIELHVLVVKSSEIRSKSPAVVFLFGSGEGSSIQNYKSFTDFYFGNDLIALGYTMVFFDKRGVGLSGGNWYNADFYQRALDARHVATAIQQLDFIDQDQILVAGHSQGGWIAQICASEYPEIFRAGISLAGPTFSVKKQLINDYMSRNLCKGIPEKKALKRAQHKVNRDLFFITLLGVSGNLKQLKIIKDFSPEAHLKNLKQPFLFLYAENDPLVSPDWSKEELSLVFGDTIPPNIQLIVAPGQNHSFKIGPKCYDPQIGKLPFSESTKSVILEWLQNVPFD